MTITAGRTSKYGCWNAERKTHYDSLQREMVMIPETREERPTGRLIVVPIEDRMSIDCKFDHIEGNPQCEGCKWITLDKR